MSAATTRSYRTGAWFGIFGDHATVLLPPSEKPRVARLWELLDDGAGFDEVLDELISGGLRELPGFVLISDLGADTKVVIRGAGRASFTVGDETVDLEGSSATTWVERTLTSVTSMSIEVEDSRGVHDLALENGLVRVSRVDAAPSTTADDEPDPPSAPGPAAVPDLGPPTEAMAPPGSGRPESNRQEAGLPDQAPSGAESDHDGMTRTGGHEPAYAPAGIAGQPQAPGVVSPPVARLVLSTGEGVEVDRAVLIGRAPEVRRLPSTEQSRLVTVPSPHQEISSTHLEIRPGSGADHGSAVATDLGSTNGSVLVQPGLPPEDLRAGIATQLVPGAILDLGDGVTIQVIDP